MPESPPPSVVCFGEILWDFLPDGLFPGGAPFNVAYHLRRHGLDARIVSAVGRDALGDELLRRLGDWKIPTDAIARPAHTPTGFVRAKLGASGDAHYEIAAGVAWDEIPVSDAALRAARRADAFIFGSLAHRTTANQASFAQLLAALPPHALRVFDVNLRPPHDDLALVRDLAAHATILKLNADEAARFAGAPATAALGHEERHARTLAARTRCTRVVITSGAQGAGLLHDGRWQWEPGRPVKVTDTIGAGDAFLASFIAHQLAGLPDAECLTRACRLGEWVATQRGATPAYAAETPR